jgi:hypothetical protein
VAQLEAVCRRLEGPIVYGRGASSHRLESAFMSQARKIAAPPGDRRQVRSLLDTLGTQFRKTSALEESVARHGGVLASGDYQVEATEALHIYELKKRLAGIVGCGF